jgi:uncharacterized protein
MKVIIDDEVYQGNALRWGINLSLNPSAMIGLLQTPEIEKVLEQQVIGRLACYADGTIYIVPIGYVYDGEYIYARTQKGLKIDLMRKNPQVCFEVDVIENMANWKSVIAWGEFEELTMGALRTDALKKLTARNLPVKSETTQLSSAWPFDAEEAENSSGVVFRMKLNKKTGRHETKEITTDFDW